MAAIPASLASLITERILVPKIACRFARSSRSSRVVMGFISCTPSCSAARPLSTFRNGTTFFSLPQVPGGRHAVHVPFHGLLEQDRREDARAVEGRAGHHPGAHGVDQVEHLRVGAVAVLVDAVLRQRLGRAAAALVQGSEETLTSPDLLELCGVHGPIVASPELRDLAHHGVFQVARRTRRSLCSPEYVCVTACFQPA